MNSYLNILDKLKQFTKKFYTKTLLKGVLLFLALGLLFFLVILGVEYFLWLNSTGRFLLLLLFVVVELILLFKYIITPLFYLFQLKKGIDNKQASLLIGKHFPEVDDKLFNLLELADDTNQSELLLASIEQRSKNLDSVPFVNAIDFSENLKYVKYLAIPFLLFGLIWITGNLNSFFGSYNRVVNYDLAYEPPAPFSFQLLSNTLDVLDNKSYTINATTIGDIRPDAVFITIDDKKILLRENNGVYQHTFSPPLSSTDFYFDANGVQSPVYRLNVLKTPSIQKFKVILDYPDYTKKSTEILNSTGNAIFPEGTKVTWNIEGNHTENIDLITKDTSLSFSRNDTDFELSQKVYSNMSYQLSTSNNHVRDFEKLEYNFKVIKDLYPTINAKQIIDSLNPNTSYYIGDASDDYLLKKIELVCYPDDDPEAEQVLELGRPNSNFNQFYYTFPSGLSLDTSKTYSFYFKATDNDAIHNGKISKSQLFSTVLLDDNQLKNKELESQQSIIKNLDKSLEKFKEQKESLKEINKNQKEKDQLNFNDQNQIKDFLKKQQQQESLMQKFSKELKDNLNKTDKDDRLNELLQERLERQEIEAKKNEKLLEELRKIADKINKDELAKRLEELGKKQQSSQRNLEQLLELTKRYYVIEKAAQLARDLEELATKQEEASEKESSDKKQEEQNTLNKEFEEIAKELEELEKDNDDLKKPMGLEISKQKEESVKSDQNDASKELKKEESNEATAKQKQDAAKKASQKQKSASQKMKEMSESLEKSSSAGGGGGSSIAEDAEMLRQILDNLITFSFKQEKLFDSLDDIDLDAPQFSGTIRKQQELRDLFEHVDDSLFSLSLRQAELSELVNEEITEVYYNIDKSLENIADNKIYQGVSYQKYVLEASNTLADFLANLLDNMQQSMQSGSGSGQGQGFQLPDIIKQQGDLQEKMEGKGESGKGQPQQGSGEGQEGEGQGDPQSGSGAKSDQGKEGKQGGENGSKGNEGQEGEGENGKSGQGGKGNGGKGGDQEGGSGGSGNGELSEQELKEIYEIYKEQQQIRERLEKQLENLINSSDRKLGEKLLRQMEVFENDLLENGFTQQTQNKMNTIQYELLKLKNAAMKQGKKQERESNTNATRFSNPIITKPSLLDIYRNEVEILNRQALPLRQNFQNKVKEYFKKND